MGSEWGNSPESKFSLRVHEKMGKDEGLWLRSEGWSNIWEKLGTGMWQRVQG